MPTAPSHVEQLMTTLSVPQHPPHTARTLWRFAFGFSSEDSALYTLAVFADTNDTEAFYRGCHMMPASAPALAADYLRRLRIEESDLAYSDPNEAFFTVEELESQDDIAACTCEMMYDVQLIVGNYGAPAIGDAS